MIEQAYLVACGYFGIYYHSGQWSRGYKLQCMAYERLQREFQMNMFRTLEQLQEDKLYPKGSEFRNLVAFFLRYMRHSRWSL